MKKFVIIFIAFLISINECALAGTNNFFTKNQKQSSIIVKSSLFSIALPSELKKQFETETDKGSIAIFHKESKIAGFGGFVFGIEAFKNPASHATLPGGRKIGELSDKKGVLYDIVLEYPTDVQFDYTKYSQIPEAYKRLMDLAENVNIQGIKGAKYFKSQGTKGEYLYNDVIKKHITAINEKWDSAKLEEENMSYMYNVLAHTNKNILDKIGYAFYDANGDGIDELFIGEIAQGNWKGVVYDIYTMVDRKPVHVVSGGSRNRYYVCDDGFICNEYSSGAKEFGMQVYIVVENSTTLYPQVGFKYDAYSNPKKPWFLSYSSDMNNIKWENVTEKTYKERKKVFEKYERFDYTPLSKF